MARPKKEDTATKTGVALVDIEALGLKSGEFASLPSAEADLYESVGMFDTKAKQ